MVEFKGKVDDQILGQFRATCAQTNLFFRVAYPVMGLTCLGFSLNLYMNNALVDALVIAIAGVFLINLRTIRMWFWWRRWKPGLVEVLGPHVSGAADANGLSLSILDQRYAWKEFPFVKLSDDCAAFYLNQTTAIPVAKSWFASQAQWVEFTGLLRPYLRSWRLFSF